jgi:exodeoxyribonuclease VII large subunit
VRLEIEFADARVGVTADADRPAAPARPVAREAKPAPKRAAKPVDQGTLF